MNSNKYLFVTDLDGTLLTTDKRVSEATEKALVQFVKDGNHFAICTGRDINSARSVYNGLGLELPGSYVVAYNGGQIYDVDMGKTIYRTGIDVELVKEIYTLADEYGIYVHTYNDDYILAREGHECLEFYRRVIKTPVKFAGDKIFDYMNVPPCKVISIELHDHEKQERFRFAAEEKFGDKLDIMYSNPYYLELIPKESGKGEALKRLCEYLEIPVKNSIAAGDGDNDISMIEAAGVGVAMINAPDSVKAAADMITRLDNDNDGLAEIILNKGNRNNIVLIGMPASGKSTVGVILAKLLGMDFVDTDLIIQKKAGRKLSQIIEEDGLEGFLAIEEEVCSKIDIQNTVIATGGSVVYGEKAMQHLKDISNIVYLEIDYETLEQRLHHMRQRGVVLKPGQTKRELYDERVELYKKYADIVISEEGLDIEETVSSIVIQYSNCLRP